MIRLVNKYYEKIKTNPLKRSKTGMEAEFHILDNNGRISSRADDLIKDLKGLKENIDVVKEIGKNMIEFGCYPDVHTYNPALDLIDSLEKTNQLCLDKGLWIYPFGTYPGKFEPHVRNEDKYQIKKSIFGPERIKISCRVTGFHHHYSLPKGVFDTRLKMLKIMRKSKLKRTMVSSYNFEIAADPALTLFTQSSPFYQGKYLGKDSRVIVYRGGKKLNYLEGLYAGLQQMGGLPPYKHTETDLLISLHKRWLRWEREVKKKIPNVDLDKIYPYKLDITWSPVKINKLGTLEQRGMDVNFMSVMVAVTVMLKFCLKRIQRDFLEVMPADFAIDEPFKFEDGILYVPPQSYVRNKLQMESAYDGYESKDMALYAKKFFKFAKSVTPSRYYKVIRPIYDMVDTKRSMSDRILSYAKYKKFLHKNTINNPDAGELALYYSRHFSKDLQMTKKRLEAVSLL
ncbi:hypothetical protein ACFLZX_06160 [Nanoarchaeota archaeon]